MNRASVLAVLLALLSSVSMAQDAVTIQKTVPYADGVGSSNLRMKCDWNTKLSGFVARYSKTPVVVTGSDLSTVQGKVLIITITHVHAIGGGFFSGPKWVGIHGELRDAGNVIGSFDKRRTTQRGFTACSALARIGKALGRDVAVWLSNPKLVAKPADAR